MAPAATSADRPNFNATNPASYDWSEYDPILNEAKRLGWQVLLTVTSPVPRWATSNLKAPYVTRPDSQDFKEFMTAVARHYGSEVTHLRDLERAQPPGLPAAPVRTPTARPASPRIYRGLYQAGYLGLQEAGLAHPKVLFGETAPTGYDSVKSLLKSEKAKALLHDVAPLAFLREALCLNAHYRKVGGCSELQMSGYAHHAYTIAAAPSYKTPGPTTSRSGCSRGSRTPSTSRPGRTPCRPGCRST